MKRLKAPEAILKALQKHAELTTSQLIDTTGFSGSMVRWTLDDLVREGKVLIKVKPRAKGQSMGPRYVPYYRIAASAVSP